MDQAVFTPSNEPYLGRQPLMAFDQLISAALSLNQHVASVTRTNSMTELQRALCQIVPAALSISLSIRELVRQGYLYGALVLLRPLAERTASGLYLQKFPAALELWHAGWLHGKRPSFGKMAKELWGDLHLDASRKITTSLNSLVHGDPESAEWNLIFGSTGSPAYSVSKMLNRPDICDHVALEAMTYLAELTGLMTAEFVGTESDHSLKTKAPHRSA